MSPPTSEGPLADFRSRFGLTASQTQQLARLAELLVADAEAPTTVRSPRQIHDDHLADSLVALELPQLPRAGRLADLGAGAGFPGLPLAIALPDLRVSLVESNLRKCAFLRRAVERTGVRNVEVVPERVEAWAAGRERYDAVTARALAPLAVVAEYAAPLLRIGGILVAWRGKRDPEVEDEARKAALILALSGPQAVQVRPYPAAQHRYLHLMSKVSPTPSRFPRRPGMARKRPLGGSGHSV